MFRRVKGGTAAVCALLSMWIYGIILFVAGARSDMDTGSFSRDATTLIIDPGHGGYDGGAVSVTGVRESDINWNIALKLYDLARFCGVNAVMTRYSSEIDYPPEAVTISQCKVWDTRSRVDMVNAVPGGVLLSIHQNIYPTPQPSGAQVFYAPGDQAHALAVHMQETLTKALQPENRRVAAPIGKDIYIMNHVQCPAILVECGFLSNPREAAQLETDAYQKQLAVVITVAFCRCATEEII